MQLTNLAATRTLDWLTGNGTTAPVLPLMARLIEILGDDDAAGTEVNGGSYAPQEVALTAAVNGSASNDSLLRYENMPAVTVRGVEVWDSAAVPVRWWHGALTAERTFTAGDPAEFSVGELTMTAS